MSLAASNSLLFFADRIALYLDTAGVWTTGTIAKPQFFTDMLESANAIKPNDCYIDDLPSAHHPAEINGAQQFVNEAQILIAGRTKADLNDYFAVFQAKINGYTAGANKIWTITSHHVFRDGTNKVWKLLLNVEEQYYE